MAKLKPSARSLIDEFLPKPDLSAAYEIRIHAPMSMVYERLRATDFFSSWIVRLLMLLRTGKRLPRHRPPSHLHHGFEGPGFVVLAERADKEIVIGVAGKFWRPDGGRRLNLKANDFVGFAQPGEAKAAWNFRLRPEPNQDTVNQDTVLSTETRIKCFGRAAQWKFHMYWAFIAPFSGLIRKAILNQVKVESELAVQGFS